MHRTLLQKANGQPLAWLEVLSNDRQQICLPCGKPMGFYLPKPNTTHTMSGALIGRGNLLTSLIVNS